jgi:hypothetical protein
VLGGEAVLEGELSIVALANVMRRTPVTRVRELRWTPPQWLNLCIDGIHARVEPQLLNLCIDGIHARVEALHPSAETPDDEPQRCGGNPEDDLGGAHATTRSPGICGVFFFTGCCTPKGGSLPRPGGGFRRSIPTGGGLCSIQPTQFQLPDSPSGLALFVHNKAPIRTLQDLPSRPRRMCAKGGCRGQA